MGETKLVSVSSLRVGNYVILDGAACAIKSIQISQPGKHGSAKSRVEAVGVLDGKKRIEIHSNGDNIMIPIIEKKPAQVLSIQGDKATVMDMETYETLDLDIPEELKEKVKEGEQIVYWVVLDTKIMKDSR